MQPIQTVPPLYVKPLTPPMTMKPLYVKPRKERLVDATTVREAIDARDDGQCTDVNEAPKPMTFVPNELRSKQL